MMKRDVTLLIIGVIVGAVLSLPFRCGRSDHPVQTSVRYRLDTLSYVQKTAPRQMLIQGHGKRIIDTSVIRHVIDTVVFDSVSYVFDTVHVTHLLPADSFVVRIGLAERVDTATVPYLARDSIITEFVAVAEDPWAKLVQWLGMLVAGILVGLAL
jgi:hypothetical protein